MKQARRNRPEAARRPRERRAQTPTRGARILPLFFLLLAPLVAACARPAPHNVVLVSIDTLRADHLGCYGYPRPTTPFLDRLAGESVRFERAYAQSSWTLPSHMSLLTSTDPEVHGVTGQHARLPQGVTPLAAVLHGAGFRTAAFVNSIYLRRKYGFGRGFDLYRELIDLHPPAGVAPSEVFDAAAVTDRVLAWLGSAPTADGHVFLFVHYFEPHADYRPPARYRGLFDPEYRGAASGDYSWLKPYIRYIEPADGRRPEPPSPADVRHVVALYDEEIRFVDDELARLYAALEKGGLLDETLLVVTADHGEEFWDHGSMEGHGWTLYEEVTHVPLLVRLPGGAHGGTTVHSLVELVDVAPTVLDLLGLPPPASFQGRSLVPLFGGGDGGGQRRWAYSQTRRFTPKQSLRGPHYRLIRTLPHAPRPGLATDPPRVELYDLEHDPGETIDLAATRPQVAANLGRVLASRLRIDAAAARARGATGRVDLTPEERSRLRSLGYIQ